MVKHFHDALMTRIMEAKSRIGLGCVSRDGQESVAALGESERLRLKELVLRKARRALHQPWVPYPHPFHDFIDQLNGGNRSLPVIYPVFDDQDLFARMHLPFVQSRREWNNRSHTAVQRSPFAAFVVLRDQDYLVWCERKEIAPESSYAQGRFLVRSVNWMSTAIVTGQMLQGARFIPDPLEEVPFWRVPHPDFLRKVTIRLELGGTYLGIVRCHLHPDPGLESGAESVDILAAKMRPTPKKVT
jgi:hypothetical protein